MEIKNEVLYRVYFLLFAVLVPAALYLFYQTFVLSVLEAEHWRMIGKNNYVQERVVSPDRGDIYAADGSLLATSVPYFDIYFDPWTPSHDDYYDNIDTLAYCMATYVDKTFTVGGYKDFLTNLRDTVGGQKKQRHVLIKKAVSFAEKEQIESFPLFNKGQFKGGLIAEKRSERKRPFGLMARRTIGYQRSDFQAVGLEGKFDSILSGVPGKQVMFNVDPSKDLWVPLLGLGIVDPRSGDDIVTTLDVNLQDITEEALLHAMQQHQPDWGTAVVMDVQTGAIKAIANLGRDDAGQGYYELYNYAIAMSTEPGSTFKLATIMALLEDGHVKLTDSVYIGGGKATFSDAEMVDASSMSLNLDSTTVQHAFEISSNVAMARLVDKYYNLPKTDNQNEGAWQFRKRLEQFNLHLPTGIEIDGEAAPYVKTPYSTADQWTKVTMPWMSTGYEVRVTPLQLLTLYNAVANKGRMMKPYLVSEIQRKGRTLETFRPTVVSEHIASSSTIERVRLLLEGVVMRGTAAKLRTNRYRFAGKTGTAQVNYRRRASGSTSIGGYQASFAGYFPADNPRYSCIVVIHKPRQGGYYGSDVAGPVFREIADKCFNGMVELHEPLNQGPRPVLYENNLPAYQAGNRDDIKTVLDYLNLPYYGVANTEMVTLSAKADSLIVLNQSVKEKIVPSVVGMGLRDAVYLLENQGLTVVPEGVGRVVRQSILPGTRAKKQTIRLTLDY